MHEKPIAAGKSSFGLIDQELFFEAVSVGPDKVLLDAACGSGAYTLALAGRLSPGAKIVAVDLWTEGIEALSREIAARGLGTVKAAVADISKRIPLGDRSTDICLLATVFHDLKEDGTDQAALHEIKRVLKPDAMLFVLEFKKIDAPPGPPASIRLSPEELEQALLPHGFLPVKTLEVGRFNYLSVFRNRT